jgi:hypothetical protein
MALRSLALVGDAFALKALGFGVRFRLFHQQQLFGFAARYGGFALALRGVDVVHRRFHFVVGDEVGDQRFHDRIAKLAHGCVEVVFHVDGDLRLLVEGFVESHLGNVAENHVVDERFDLLDGVGEFVKGVVDVVRQDFVLHGNRNLDEDIVFRFRFDFYVELLDLEADVGDDHVEIGHFEIQAELSDAQEFAEALDDSCVGLLDGEERAEENAEQENCDDAADDQHDDCRNFHKASRE